MVNFALNDIALCTIALEWGVAILLVMGGFFVFVAGLGLLRMPDTFIRMHATTKAGTLGVGLMLCATMLHFADLTTTARGLIAIVFIVMTAPVAAHMLGRAAYKTGTPLWTRSVIDEWQRDSQKKKAK